MFVNVYPIVFFFLIFGIQVANGEEWAHRLQNEALRCQEIARAMPASEPEARVSEFKSCFPSEPPVRECIIETTATNCPGQNPLPLSAGCGGVSMADPRACGCSVRTTCQASAEAQHKRLISGNSLLLRGDGKSLAVPSDDSPQPETTAVSPFCQDNPDAEGCGTCSLTGPGNVREIEGAVEICMENENGIREYVSIGTDCTDSRVDPAVQTACIQAVAGIDGGESAAADERAAGPLDTNKDGTVSEEERETADTDGDGRISDEEEAQAAERQAANPEQISACDAAFAEASLCCGNPLACLVGGNDATVGNNVQAGIGMVMQGGQMYAGMQQQDAQMNGQASTAMCDFMNTASTAGAGINAASAAVCMQKKSACNQVCNGVSTGKCNQFNVNVAQSAVQAVSGALAASIANQCKDMTASSNGLAPSDIEFLPDCSDPANSSNPNCNGECSGPNAASNPFCKTGTGSGGTGDGTAYAMHEANFGDNSGNFDSNPDLMGGIGNQESLGAGAEGQAQANAIQGGGGGGMGGGAGGASLGDGQSGKAQGGGYNTNVLKGASGGGGYVGPSTGSVGVSSGGGGFRGYGRARAGNDDTIDLKQFLPGGKKDPRKRTVAGIAGATAAQIGRKETNIFQTMSVKYRQMCQLKRMWDCPKLSRSAARRSR